MAKYEDYVKNDLDTEIDEAAENSQERHNSYQIPERFKGKSAEDIARAWEEANSLIGRQSSELGELRKTVDKLVEAQLNVAVPPKTEAARKPVTVDEIYENADDSIRRVVREESQTRIDELERRLQAADARAALAVFEAKHPTYRQTMQDPNFAEWVKSSNYRMRMAQSADKGDLDAADELFSTYAEISKAKQPEQTKQSKRDAVKAAGLETSGGSAPSKVEKYSRSKLESLRVRARQGDPEAERYLSAHGDDILLAYSEGRIVN